MNPETAAAQANARRRGPARSRVHGQQWFRTTARRSALSQRVIKRVRGRNAPPPSDSKIENEKTRGGSRSARVNQTRLDDGITPVFCPTCQNLPLN
ncbi:hypothetical protein I6F16_17000 [Bradyrhizobium sp. IC4060]|nr:hypothetical protein [Bradyrhizobium sp. IC4060]MCA1485453.1 hypothetical protein [Bradyrhizobium sp. IC4061]